MWSPRWRAISVVNSRAFPTWRQKATRASSLLVWRVFLAGAICVFIVDRMSPSCRTETWHMDGTASALLCEISWEWLTGKIHLNLNPTDFPQINR